MAMAVEADEELELSLGLSLGGRVLRKKSESPRTVPVMDLGFEGGVSTVEAYGDGGDLGKKCEEKERKRGFFFGNVGLVDVEAQQFRSRARDRAKRETEASRSEGQRKEGEKCNEKNLAVTLDSSYPPQANSKSCPMVPMQFPVHPVQYLPVGYGYPSPCVMPFWAPPSAQGATPPGKGPVLDTPAVPPAAFRPFRRGNQPVPGNADSEQSVGKAVSGGGSPSQTSDNQSAYLQGGCSTESGSHSSCSPREHPQRQLSQHASAAQACSDYATALPHAEEANRNSIAQPSAEKPQGTASETKPILVSPSVFSLSPPRPVSASLVTSSCCPNPSEERTNENREQQLPCQGIPALPKMPCVSTTGNGPNGKTITGFLYKYTKTEVSIVCVCHGSSFSPAEFVKHAGGTDVSHPLKHIVVVPTTF